MASETLNNAHFDFQCKARNTPVRATFKCFDHLDSIKVGVELFFFQYKAVAQSGYLAFDASGLYDFIEELRRTGTESAIVMYQDEKAGVPMQFYLCGMIFAGFQIQNLQDYMNNEQQQQRQEPEDERMDEIENDNENDQFMPIENDDAIANTPPDEVEPGSDNELSD